LHAHAAAAAAGAGLRVTADLLDARERVRADRGRDRRARDRLAASDELVAGLLPAAAVNAMRRTAEPWDRNEVAGRIAAVLHPPTFAG